MKNFLAWGSASRRRRSLAFLALLTALVWGNGLRPAGATELTLFKTVLKANYVSAGVGGLRERGVGTINLTGVTGPVREAYLYWHGHGISSEYTADPNPQTGARRKAELYVNGQLITGQAVGTSGPNSWDFPDYNFHFGRAFRANVTSLVQAKGDGTYYLEGFDPFIFTVQGASLLVFFDGPDAGEKWDLTIYEGCDQNSENTFDTLGWNLAIPGATYVEGTPAYLELHVSDGQEAYLESDLLLNGQIVAPRGQIFPGAAPYDTTSGFRHTFFTGSLWDIEEFDIAPFLIPGLNDLLLTTDHLDDDLTLVVTVLKLPPGGTPPGGDSGNRPPTVSSPNGAVLGCAPPEGVAHTTTISVADADGDPLTVIWRINTVEVQRDLVPAGAPTTAATLSLTAAYLPDTYTISITVSDGRGGIAVRQTAITVTSFDVVAPVVDCGPSLRAVTGSVDPASTVTVPNVLSQVTASDDCTPADELRFSQAPAAGTLVGVGEHQIQVTVRDLAGNSGICSVLFVVTLPEADGGTPPPVTSIIAKDDLSETFVNTPVTTGNVLANDTHSTGATLTVTAFDAYSTEAGTVEYLGSGTFRYTPPVNFVGSDSFAYTAGDAAGNKGSATVHLTVHPVNQPPVAVDDFAATQAGVPVSISVLDNDSDPDGDPVTVISFTAPSHGSATMSAAGNSVYTPAVKFIGTDRYQYVISDGKLTATATVTVVVTGNDYTTFTQGGWSSTPSGNNPGSVLEAHFGQVYPSGVTIGGSHTLTESHTLTFTSAAAVRTFLAQSGGTPVALTASQVDPAQSTTVLANQTLALKLNVDFSAHGVTTSGLGSLRVTKGKLSGWTVNQVLALANQMLGGQPGAISLSELNDIVTDINENYVDGKDRKFLTP